MKSFWNDLPFRRRHINLVAVAVVLIIVGLWYWDTQRPEPPDRTGGGQVVHAEEDDGHKHTNHLIDESSPYLLQHAHNPVNWYPWGEEAFEKAKREDKPVFLSVGYSTCYWCHVMEKESFEDEEVAKILNEHYVSIKVDREERPDIDEQYMLATQLINQRGGWPNSVWLTPEGKPWMAGTYFPKEQFMTILNQLADVWENRRADVENQADQLSDAIAQAGGATVSEDVELTKDLVDQAVNRLSGRFDPSNGGFGRAPKFPPHGTLALLIRQYQDTGEESLVTPITETLDAMWLGGMHDHIGGGFHRYATDAEWLLPHFEKMLYDNGQLMRAYADGAVVFENDRYRRAVEDIYRWLMRDMTSDAGAFYSAIDSGEVDKEGESYVWHIDEVKEVLGPEDGALFAEVYNFEEGGNFREEATGHKPGTNIPHLDKPLEAIAKERGEEPDEFVSRMANMREKLLAHRETWPQPHTDDKILTSWNGLMIGSLAYAGRLLEEPRYTEAAAKAADFILDEMTRDGVLLRAYRTGEAKLHGYLDDYAFFVQALIELHLATGEQRWLEQAEHFADTLLAEFQDTSKGGFFFTTDDHDDLIMRSKSLTGGGNMPSANGVAAQALFELSRLTEEDTYEAAAVRTLESLAGVMKQSPFSSEHLLLAVARHFRGRASGESTALATASRIEESSAGRTTATGITNGKPDVSKRVNPVTLEVYASPGEVEPGSSFELAVAIDIDDGWHLYGENPDLDFLIPTTVNVTGPDDVSPGPFDAPEPHEMEDPILEETVRTYSGRIWFRSPVTVSENAAPGEMTVSLEIKTQACDDSSCLPPETTVIDVPVQIAAAG